MASAGQALRLRFSSTPSSCEGDGKGDSGGAVAYGSNPFFADSGLYDSITHACGAGSWASGVVVTYVGELTSFSGSTRNGVTAESYAGKYYAYSVSC